MARSSGSAVFVSKVALLDTMAQQADGQCARIAGDAQAEAERIIEQARADAAAHRDAVWRAVKAEEAHKDRMSAQFARVEADKARLAARNAAVSDVMALVDREISRIVESPEFGAILQKLLGEALAASEGPVVIECPAAQAELCRSTAVRLGADVREVVASRTIRDGVAVWNPERTVRISNTLRGRLAILEDEARKHIVQRLFTGRG